MEALRNEATLKAAVAGMGASVLLVDDDPQIVRAIVPALEVSGWTVTVAMTGADALKHVDGDWWDVLVVDLGLPDMDGKTIIRHSKSRSAVPVIVISAQHSKLEVEAAESAGASCFLHKPFRTPELVERIRESLAAAGSAGRADCPAAVQPHPEQH